MLQVYEYLISHLVYPRCFSRCTGVNACVPVQSTERIGILASWRLCRELMLMLLCCGVQVHIRWGAGLPPQSEDAGAEQQHEDGSQKEAQDSQKEQQDASVAAERKKQKKAAKDLRPYCTVAAGPAACVSRPADSGRDAQWRETSFLYIRYPDFQGVEPYTLMCRQSLAGCACTRPCMCKVWRAPVKMHLHSVRHQLCSLVAMSVMCIRSYWYMCACMQGPRHAAGCEGI